MDSFEGNQVEAVIRTLCGEPNKALSKPGAWRYGTNGSLAIDLEKATWFDHEQGVGGGILDLVVNKQGAQGRQGNPFCVCLCSGRRGHRPFAKRRKLAH